jgi:SAM-dependent methyltransferase
MQTSAERFNTISENFTKSEVPRLGASMIRFSELIGGTRDLTIGDVACGPGHFGFSLAGHAARIVGIDPSHNMLKQFRDLGSKFAVPLEDRIGTAEDLPAADEEFDLTISRLAPHHFSDVRKAIAQMSRVTKKGGIVGIVDLEGCEGFTVHRLVQEITRQRLSDSEKESALERALEILNGKLPSSDWDQKGWQLWERLAPHCRTLLARLRDHALEPKATRMMNRLATWLANRAEHSEAESLYQRSLAIREKALGPEHPNVATVLENYAFLLQRQSSHGHIEAMASDLPVIATRIAGIPEIVAENQNGLLADEQSPDQLALAIGRLLDNRPLRQQFGTESQPIGRPAFRLDKTVAQLRGLFAYHAGLKDFAPGSSYGSASSGSPLRADRRPAA